MLKQVAKRIIPPRIWSRLRRFKIRNSIANYRPRQVSHQFGGFPLTIQLADPLGEGWYDQDWPELPEIALLRQHALKPGARVFDLGAHQAVVALMLARIVGRQGQVVAVEAESHNVTVARTNRDLNDAGNLDVVHAAVASKPGTVEFFEGLNGSVDPSGGWGRVSVPARTIDDLAREYGPPDVLFIDVEGYEREALLGATETLTRRPDAYVEIHVGEPLSRFGATPEEVIAFFPEEHYDRFIAADQAPEFVPLSFASPLLKDRFFLIALARDRSDG